MYEIATLAVAIIAVSISVLDTVVKLRKGKGRHRK